VTTSPMPLNAADLTAKAYGRRLGRLPVRPETLGLAVFLIVNRNTASDRALWLTAPDVHTVVADIAEAFAVALTGHPSPEGWRGGALASLRTLAGESLHEVTEPWPWSQTAEPRQVDRFWVDDPEHWYHRRDGRPAVVRAELLRRLAGHRRIEDAWQTMQEALETPVSLRKIHVRGVLASWDNLHERPSDTEWLHSELLGRDPQADLHARVRESMTDG
jgi:hypothetical protein